MRRKAFRNLAILAALTAVAWVALLLHGRSQHRRPTVSANPETPVATVRALRSPVALAPSAANAGHAVTRTPVASALPNATRGATGGGRSSPCERLLAAAPTLTSLALQDQLHTPGIAHLWRATLRGAVRE
jgi:hypothetical protein